MKRLFLLGCLVFLCVLAWRIGARLSSDAIAMSVGVLFGIGAGIPVALLVLAAGRRREDEAGGRHEGRRYRPDYGGQYAHPPVIVVAGPGQYGGNAGPAQFGQSVPALSGPQAAYEDAVDVRQFKVVGEQEEWVDEW